MVLCFATYGEGDSQPHILISTTTNSAPNYRPQADLTRLATEIENPLVVFCVATYGEGDPTDNAQDLFDWLKEDEVEENSLKGLNYAVCTV